MEILEGEIAKLFGKESSLLVPSGTMSNLIGMMVNTRRKGEGAIVGHLSHIYNLREEECLQSQVFIYYIKQLARWNNQY